MKKIKYLLKLIFKKRGSSFIKDIFILSAILLGVVSNILFFKYTGSKMGGIGDVAGASLAGVSYEIIFDGEKFLKIPFFVIGFSLINIIAARFLYRYDLLASYILAASVPVFNMVYFFSTYTIFSIS